ncbi:hypothetical protein [Filimonas effusa]|uniref:Uncharacterized protein n=1 Tax=Filimonas effusa TaxID=2508721 RepID=A0A4Q1D5Q9_9BACT|nr:hypothetical protein [Filimonas effusa]RXK83193.1 hypothetical protein ESB13_13835 [Filimonas effusa]
MKNYVLRCTLVLIIFSACSRKTTPPASGNTNAQIVYPNKTKPGTTPVTPAIPDTTTVPITTNEKILVILDKGGRLAVSSKSVPPYVLANNKVLPANAPITATQRSNMLARHHVLLPLALYVPDAKASKSAKGDYYRYQNKFWYWKKADGFFYLDDIYYK